MSWWWRGWAWGGFVVRGGVSGGLWSLEREKDRKTGEKRKRMHCEAVSKMIVNVGMCVHHFLINAGGLSMTDRHTCIHHLHLKLLHPPSPFSQMFLHPLTGQALSREWTVYSWATQLGHSGIWKALSLSQLIRFTSVSPFFTTSVSHCSSTLELPDERQIFQRRCFKFKRNTINSVLLNHVFVLQEEWTHW